MLIQQIDPQSPEGFGTQIMFIQVFPDACTALRCETYEWEWWANAHGADRIELPAGRYLMSMLADGDAVTTATLTFEGLEGATWVQPTLPAGLWASVLGEGSMIGDGLEHVIEGGVDGELNGPGFVLVLGWQLTDLGWSGDVRVCWGRPSDPDVFDNQGGCRRDVPASGSSWCCSTGLRSLYHMSWCGLDQVRCQPGPLRLAFRDTTTAVATAAGALGVWATYGLGKSA